MRSTNGIVFDIKKFSVHDGPGIRTTIFLKGCPLHCAWCHNPEGQSPNKEIHFWSNRCIACHECIDACEYNALSLVENVPTRDQNLCQGCGACAEACPAEATELIGKTMTVSEVMQEIQKDILYYDQSGGGVTFSGGEPLLQVNFLEAILEVCKDRAIHSVVDTSGFVQYETIHRVRSLVDLFLYDIKIIDEFRHIHFTGVPNRLILDNLIALSNSGSDIIVRIPIIPGINDCIEDIDQLGKFLVTLEKVHPVNILPYHSIAIDKYARMNSVYSLQDLQPPTSERMVIVAEQLESFGLSVSIGG